MSNRIIERLKAGPNKKSTIIRALNNLLYMFRYDDESGGIIGIDQGGYLMTREEAKDLIEGMNTAFDYYSDEEIERYNNQPKNQEQLITKPEAPSKSKAGWVYIVKGQGNQYKIGLTTREPNKRLAEFTPRLPFKTTLIHTIYAYDVFALEENIHERLADKRINGEWFELNNVDLNWLMGGAQ